MTSDEQQRLSLIEDALEELVAGLTANASIRAVNVPPLVPDYSHLWKAKKLVAEAKSLRGQ